MKILFITNIPSPYRVDFFNEFGKHCDLTVCFERQKAIDRDVRWTGTNACFFREIYSSSRPFGTDKSIGFGIIRAIKTQIFDKLIISGYASPAIIFAITYCRLSHIPYYVESDGGFNHKKKGFKRLIKRFLLCGAAGHYTTCEEHIAYLTELGIPRCCITKYPFSSVKEEDIISAVPTKEEKQAAKKILGISEEKMLLSVGQLIPRKGFDVLMQAAYSLPENTAICIVGGKPSQELLDLQSRLGLHKVYFVDFLSKDRLKYWYRAADVFILPTRQDVWGLVINEAMAQGLPIITTDMCGAGVTLVDSTNGVIVPAGDPAKLKKAIDGVLKSDEELYEMSKASLGKIREYTIEKMAECHVSSLR